MGALLAREARFLGEALAPGRLYDLGEFPGMKDPASPGEEVRGEVYELEEALLLRLDEYEGCGPDDPQPSAFARCRRRARLADGRTAEVWVYLYRAEIEEQRRIASGDYLKK
jgi:gamma-glutamylcyclotransferase (GGCT)/AIG2-like uncharacterized protein YtfP